MRKLGIAILGLLLGCMVAGMGLYTMWTNFTPESILGSRVSTTETDLSKITTTWFNSFFDQYTGIQVPFDYRIKRKSIQSITVLDETNNYVQLDYLVKPTAAKAHVGAYYNAVEQEDGWYLAQLVVKWETMPDGYLVGEKMTPAQYQLQTDITLREPQTTHYARNDETETYFFDNQKLYVTYDAGESSIQVPVDYKAIAGTNNGTYNELLASHGYIVSKAFTAFVYYDEQGCYMVYSEDAGKTWKNSFILNVTYQGDLLYLSKTNQGCYITLATDRSLGHEYYATYQTNDYQTWSYMDSKAIQEKKHVIFFNDGVAYAEAGVDEQKNIVVSYTNDNWQSYQTLIIPYYETTLLNTTIKPFVVLEDVYTQDGLTYLIVGQGANGDYVKQQVLVKGQYVSEDGIHFTFEKELYDAPVVAG